MIKVKLDVTKLDKTAFFKGQKGTYVDLVLWECKGGQDQFGNDFQVKQDMGKDRRAEKTPIIGSAKFAGTSKAPERSEPAAPEAKFSPGGGYTAPAPHAPAAPEANLVDDGDVPF